MESIQPTVLLLWAGIHPISLILTTEDDPNCQDCLQQYV